MIAKKYPDVSFDLETLSTKPNALILSIGVCVFDRNTGEIGRRTQFFVNPLSQPLGDISVSTTRWWVSQDNEARERMKFGILEESVGIRLALSFLDRFLTRTAVKGFQAWGNGPSFDNVILTNAYLKYGRRDPPWKYWNDRCVRTMRGVVEDKTGLDIRDLVEFSGTPHDAGDDAEHQAKLICEAYKLLDARRQKK